MKRFILICLFLATLQSCKQEISQSDLSKLNGYWEIEKVILPNGEKKDYRMNESIDYLEIKDSVGFRKKVYPQLNGKFTINNTSEKVVITNLNSNYFLNYSTEYAKWKEQIIEIKDSVLVTKHEADLEYHYKKYRPFSLK